MMTMLLIAGIAVLAAGLLTIAFGIPVKEFSLGNTLILAGAVTACTGVITLGLAVVVRELRNIARRLGPASPAVTGREKREPQLPSATANQPAPETLEGAEPASRQPRSAASAAPWKEEVVARDRGRGDDGAPEATLPELPEPPAATKPRRNLLFSSSSRKERERTALTPDAPAADPAPPVPPPAPKENAPASFEDAWPQSDRARSDASRRSRTPSTFAEPNATASAPERAAPPARSEEPAPVTVLKSGVVDGMAYSLYSDGSIEAQMPEGMMRFASIDELRSHLDQRP
jgi:hypothetical protein